MPDISSRSLSFRVAEDVATELETLAEATARPRSWLLEQALQQYLERQRWQIGHMQAGIRDLDAGNTVPHEDVTDWLGSWGTAREAEPPS